MPEFTPIYYETAPASYREAGFLARCYGFPDVGSFAEALPTDAAVADLGAGHSNLGRVVVDLRRDVTWTNIDVNYAESIPSSNNFILDCEKNLDYIKADVLELEQAFGGQKFDRVLSYWMLPYLTLAGRQAGMIAARNMLELAKPEGSVSVGPETGINGFLKLMLKRKNTVSVKSPANERELAASADFLVEATKLGRYWSRKHKQASLRDPRSA